MSDTPSGEHIQAKIQAARREAEGLKDKIKTRKDGLADTSRMLSFPSQTLPCLRRLSNCGIETTLVLLLSISPLLLIDAGRLDLRSSSPAIMY